MAMLKFFHITVTSINVMSNLFVGGHDFDLKHGVGLIETPRKKRAKSLKEEEEKWNNSDLWDNNEKKVPVFKAR